MNNAELGAVAKRFAICLQNRNKKTCRRGDCSNCNIVDPRIFESLSPIEVALIQDRAELIIAAQQSVKRDKIITSLKNKSVLITIIIATILIMTVWCRKPKQSLHDDLGYSSTELVNKINIILRKTDQFVCDVDGDDKIDCVDFTTTFYTLWLTYYPNDEGNIEIVRNIGMNHLFVRVREDTLSMWEFIEPQAYGVESYFMEDCWPEYNPLTNVYGETNRWLRLMKKKTF